MASSNDIRHVDLNIGLTAGTASMPVFKNITENGCIRILDANIWSGGAGTITAYLTCNDPTGGTVLGTICQLGTADHVYAAAGTSAVRTAATITTAVVPANTTVCVKLDAGTAGSDTTVDLAYVKGQ